MTDQEQEIARWLAVLDQRNTERAAEMRRGWYLLGAALGCLIGFTVAVLLAWRLGFPWWLIAAAVIFEVGGFVCLRFSDRGPR